MCTQEMDDLSQKAIKLVIEYCLEVLEEVEAKIPGKASLARLEPLSTTSTPSYTKIRCTSTTGRCAIPS